MHNITHSEVGFRTRTLFSGLGRTNMKGKSLSIFIFWNLDTTLGSIYGVCDYRGGGWDFLSASFYLHDQKHDNYNDILYVHFWKHLFLVKALTDVWVARQWNIQCLSLYEVEVYFITASSTWCTIIRLVVQIRKPFVSSGGRQDQSLLRYPISPVWARVDSRCKKRSRW